MTIVIDNESLLQRNDAAFLSAELDSELVLMHLESSDYFGMDKTTTQIWKLLEQPKTIAELVADLEQLYMVAADKCEADIRPVLEDMVSRDFVHLVTTKEEASNI